MHYIRLRKRESFSHKTAQALPQCIIPALYVSCLTCFLPNWIVLAERKTSLEKLGFEGSQISSRIFAETELEPTRLLTVLQLGTQLTPALTIIRSQVFSREKVLLGGNSSNET